MDVEVCTIHEGVIKRYYCDYDISDGYVHVFRKIEIDVSHKNFNDYYPLSEITRITTTGERL